MKHLGGNRNHALALHAALAALAAALLFLLAGPAVGQAEAASACKRFGGDPAYELRKEPARNAILCLLNRERRERGLPALRQDDKLERASQRHNEYMVEHKCFAHDCPGEATLEQRLRIVDYLRGGLLRWAYGENIAWGEEHLSTPRAMVRAWMDSSGHRHNILNPSFKEVGVGVSGRTPVGRNRKGGTYTTDFGLAIG